MKPIIEKNKLTDNSFHQPTRIGRATEQLCFDRADYHGLFQLSRTLTQRMSQRLSRAALSPGRPANELTGKAGQG
jgi:hypothetical protein